MALVVRHPIILKYWMGHKVSKGRDIEARYIVLQTPEQLKLYKDAYKNIDLTQAGLEERVKFIEEITKALTPEQKEKMPRYGIRLGARRTETKPEKKDNSDCADGEHCGEDFKQIGEAELLRHLKEGWQIIHRLGNGDVIVKR